MKAVLDYIGSAKFAFLITVLILIMSFIGSVVSFDSINNIKHSFLISLFFDPNTNHFLDFAMKTGIIDIYRTPYFLTLLFLFTLSMVICTIRLIPFAIKGYRALQENSLKHEKEITHREEEVVSFFKKNRWSIKKGVDGVYMAEKHKAGRFGVIFLHTGILLVMAGALIGYLFGFNGFAGLFPGGETNYVEENGKKINLGFTLKVNTFDITYYEDSHAIKAYTTNATVYENGKEVLTTDIDVNHPLKYKNVIFYQASYGEQINASMKFGMLILSDGKYHQEYLPLAKPVQFKDYVMIVKNVLYDVDNPKAEKFIRPGILLSVIDKGGKKLYEDIVPFRENVEIPGTDIVLQFGALQNYMWTGLSVKKDPGTVTVYVGGILMCISVLMIYFLDYTAVSFTVRGGRIRYNVRHQRKFPVVRPVNKFYTFLEK